MDKNDAVQSQRPPSIDIAEPDVRAALDAVVLESLRPVSTGLTLLYVIYTVSLLAQPKGAAAPASIVAAGTALVLLALRHALGRRAVPSHWAHPIGAGITGLVLLNILLRFAFLYEPQQITYLALLLLGAGALFLSARWLALTLAVALVGEGVVVWLSASLSDWLSLGLALLATAVLSAIVHSARLRTYRRLARLRIQDELLIAELEAALRTVRQSEEKLRDEIAESERAEKELQHRLQLESLVTSVSTHFITPGEVDVGIKYSLQAIGEISGVDRCYAFTFSAGVKMDNTQEWCAEGIEPQMESLQGLPSGILPWWCASSSVMRMAMEKLNRFENVHIPSVAGLPPEASAEKGILQAQGIQSILIVPMIYGGALIGFLGFDSVRAEKRWAEGDIALLKMVGEVFANALARRRAEEALAEERALLARRVEERTVELSAANLELARAARLKDEFLASMSHELRTPLNAILGMSETLQEQVYGPLNEEQLDSLRTVEESGRHLLSLINDILDISKIEAGKLELQIGPLPVESVCQASLQFVKQEAHKKRIKVSLTQDSAVTALQADGRRLKQILVNLLTNAVKFTSEGGAIGLEVAGDAQKGLAHFTVWDTGIGISQEDRGRLFQPFVQLDSSLSRQYAGTGLGLALVHRLTKMHGGSVSLESQVGRGSRFTVSLPWQTPVSPVQGGEVEGPAEVLAAVGEVAQSAYDDAGAGTSATPAPRRDLQAGRFLILLAEDNQHNIDMISNYLLLSRGYRVAIARNGREVLERAREERPHLILMDIQMPEMDGLEAIRHIRADADLATIPIIALTALAMPGDRERSLEAGADDYLSKPVRLKKLVEAIEIQLGGITWNTPVPSSS
jgi:signal transduction histidine kinase/ActR/RegA family two-component response regulator